MRQGDIYWIEFSSGVGHEFKGRRPAVVIQSDSQIKKTNTITVMPLTGNLENKLLDDIFVPKDSKNKLSANSVIKVYYIMSFDKERFVKKIGVVNVELVQKIQDYLKKHFI